ncbi:MFS transporter [Paenibacillus solisilvae]|uniref:MFS transporter n=1 Tax=Paenibacillus solisilvae TaxID=2486751 RepID=A0ABW0W2N0_9BACL
MGLQNHDHERYSARNLRDAALSIYGFFVGLVYVKDGVGDSALHYCTQLWIVSSSPADKRGYISLYGMAYGVGFSIGPLGINLMRFRDAVPFITSAVFFVLILLLVAKLPHQFPEKVAKAALPAGNWHVMAYRFAWFALIPGFLYGLMEASMNSSFPLYGLRIELSEQWISLLLPALGIGSLLLMFPLGMLSDRIGRKPVLMACGLAGGLLFLTVPLAGNHAAALLVLLALIGGVIGSFYSLGLAYPADVLPKVIMPTANVIASIHFSIGSLLSPSIGGYGIRYVSVYSMFILLDLAYLLFAICGFFFKKREWSS